MYNYCTSSDFETDKLHCSVSEGQSVYIIIILVKVPVSCLASIQINGTACAIPRILLSLLENNQQEVRMAVTYLFMLLSLDFTSSRMEASSYQKSFTLISPDSTTLFNEQLLCDRVNEYRLY